VACSSPLVLLQVLVDDIEQADPQGPLAIHPVGRLAEHVGPERQPMRPAQDVAPHHACLFEDLEVLGDRGLGHPEAAGGVPDGRGAGGQPLDDLTTDRVGEGLERIVNQKVNSSSRRRPPRVSGDAAARGATGSMIGRWRCERVRFVGMDQLAIPVRDQQRSTIRAPR
jgi:hypothetical protein